MKHANPLATKQKWYCPKCQAGYKTKWGGVIIEMVVNRKVFDIPLRTKTKRISRSRRA